LVTAALEGEGKVDAEGEGDGVTALFETSVDTAGTLEFSLPEGL